MTCPSYSWKFNHPDYIKWRVQTVNFLIVKPSPLPILIPLWPKYSPRDPISKTISLHSSLNERDHVSHTYSSSGNIIVLYILIFKFLERCLEVKNFSVEILVKKDFNFLILNHIIFSRELSDEWWSLEHTSSNSTICRFNWLNCGYFLRVMEIIIIIITIIH